MTSTLAPEIKAFFDSDTNTITYVVADTTTSACAIIDSVLDYDPTSGRTNTKSADSVISYILKSGYRCQWIVETHIHADHLTAAPYLKNKLGGKTAIGNDVTTVQRSFGPIFNAESSFATDGRQFDHLFSDDEVFKIGNIDARVITTPGHTPACISYVIGENCFVGDTMFMPDAGTARCDFPGGNAATLYDSLQRILSLPDETKLYMCHDYGPGGRDYKWVTSVKEQREKNIHLAEKSRAEYIEIRTTRDTELSMPKLILPSVQINMRGGNFPPADNDGVSYIKIPLDKL
ncbi:MAG: MBL fold metallo-hydrolase [Kordiimonadaceae bacterium]|jgi:glyoxylase-like metal-dependent hydrolase (beta-lactamase superfamily II)|nr:MBL fold metallo-hydrolase [Kordiimonadaceae bacterium]MDB4043909.1 MBL fold metallo-hydrolase [Emcibacteraceae bacterium]MDC0080812.1 MBL fold metallo-hydrolase [Emcibacteraceae bacterium]MDC1428304.1 MBL fold metallo-hydrolase [Emcibacteraceae bacterium]